jgi:hypothetical protein
MPLLVHLAPASKLPLIRRNGLKRVRQAGSNLPACVFAIPLTPNFFVSHQWLRELRRRGQGPLAGVYFRIPDEEPVLLGHYGQAHRPLTASQATAEFLAAADPLGWEVLIPRSIRPAEIHRVRALPQILGWRYFPGSHGRTPCACPYCTRGEFGGARLRNRLN